MELQSLNDYYSNQDTIKACKIMLQAYESIPDQLGFIVSFAIKVTKVSDKELAEALDISQATINRWKNEKCSQHKALREHTIKFFLDKLSKRD